MSVFPGNDKINILSMKLTLLIYFIMHGIKILTYWKALWTGLFSAQNESGDIINKCTEISRISNNIIEMYQRCNHKHGDTVIHDFY